MPLDPKVRDAYAAARQAVLDAQAGDPDPEVLAAAHRRLVEATAPVADAVQVAWDANVEAVQAAKAAVIEATYDQARVEVEAGNAARARNPFAPVLSADELDRCHEAAARTTATRQALVEAQVLFKAGVSADQLNGVP